MKYRSLLPWTIASYIVLVTYVVALRALERKLFLKEDDVAPTGSISRYIESPGSSGAFAACMTPILTTQWVAVALYERASIVNVVLLLISQISFTLVVTFEVLRHEIIHNLCAFVFTVTASLYMLSTFAWVDRPKRPYMYITFALALGIIGMVKLADTYTNAEDTVYYTEVTGIVFLLLLLPIRDYLMT
jgi:hypothetical protein